jgi:hypothetical protein
MCITLKQYIFGYLRLFKPLDIIILIQCVNASQMKNVCACINYVSITLSCRARCGCAGRSSETLVAAIMRIARDADRRDVYAYICMGPLIAHI